MQIDLHLILVGGDVELAADEDEDGLVRLDVPLGLHHPDGDVLVAVAVADVVDQQGAHRVPVVRLCYRPENKKRQTNIFAIHSLTEYNSADVFIYI